MKKVLSIAILFVFGFLLAGYLVVYEVSLTSNRASMQDIIKAGSLQKVSAKIVLSQAEAALLIDGHEITYQHKRYDIVSIEKTSDKVILKVINDEKEESLMDGLNNAYDCLKNPAQHKTPSNLLNDFFKEYTPGLSLNLCRLQLSLMVSQVRVYTDKGLNKGYWHCFIPPPKA